MTLVVALANIATFNSKLNEFLAIKKYCDVTIHVEGKSFRCHRLALTVAVDYFDAMFSGHFQESQADDIILKDITAVAFEGILRFIYTGHVVVTKENVSSLLHASEFFKIVSVEELCIQFIRENLPLPEMFEILSFASLTRKNSLINVVSRYIAQNFDEFSTDPRFLELSFDDLYALMSQRWYLSPENEDKFLDAVNNWLCSSYKTREEGFKMLLEKTQLQYISEDYVEFLSRKFTSTSKCTNFPDNDSSFVKYSDLKRLSNRPALGMHVYTEGFDGITRVFSTSKNFRKWGLSCVMEHKYDHVTCIALDDFLYCLDYVDLVPTFRVCSSIDVSSPNFQPLKVPPAILMEFDMCNIQKNIYLNSSYESKRNLRHTSNYAFNDDEIQQGIYLYNVEIDEWFPLPLLNRFLSRSSSGITTCNGVLYLVGDLADSAHPTPCVSIRALDHRMSKWQELPRSTYHTAPYNLSCCTHEEKIYVCGGYKTSDVEIGMYDIVAGKWQEVKCMDKNYFVTFRLLSYENSLWAFTRSKDYYINIQTFNSYTHEWNPSPIPGMIGEECSAFMDVVLFKAV